MCLGFIGFKDLMKQQFKNKRTRVSLIWIFQAFKQLGRLCSVLVNRMDGGVESMSKMQEYSE